MEEMNSKAEQIIEERKVLLENIKRKEDTELKNLIDLILSVFKVSNEIAMANVDADFLVHKILLIFDEDNKTITSSVSFDEIDKSEAIESEPEFYKQSEMPENRTKLAVKLLNEANITEKVLKKAYEYFQNLDGYYAQSAENCFKNEISLLIEVND